MSARFEAIGVVVEDLGRSIDFYRRLGLVRASCGWWTNEDDLQRLAAAVAET